MNRRDPTSSALEAAEAALSRGDSKAAEQGLRDILRRRPGDPRALDLLARGLAAQGRFDEAAECLRSLAAAADADPRIRTDHGKLLRLAGRADEAERELRSVLTGHPDQQDAARTLAFLLRDQGRWPEAGEVMVRACDAERDPDALMAAAGFLWELSQYRAAAGLLERCLAARPSDARARLLLGRTLEALGEFDAALGHFRDALALRRDLPGAWLRLTWFRRVDDPADPDLAALAGAVDDASLGTESRACAAFARGKALDDLGEYRQAFESFSRANRLWPHRGRWRADDWHRQVQETIHAFPTVGAGAPAGDERIRPVFIVGMLRSGTTLLERRLAEHPSVAGRGELNWVRDLAGNLPPPGWPGGWPAVPAAQRRDLRDAYLRLGMRGERGLAAFVDKNPLNFRYLGLIAELFPDAVLVHMERDPRDVGLSLFQQAFEDPENAYAYDLDDIVAFHHGYRRLMRHWQDLLGERLVSVRYEDLVADPEAQVTRVLRAAGLEAAIESPPRAEEGIRTASAWQARQPVHGRSVARWRHYRELAPAFFDALAPS